MRSVDPSCLLYEHLMLSRHGFITVKEAVVLDTPEGRAVADRGNSDRVAQTESEVNHQHFTYSIGKTPYGRWQNNLALALSLRECWAAKLRLQFPERDFVFVIHNELNVRETMPRLQLDVMPTLRMWTRQNDPLGELSSGFLEADNALDMLVENTDHELVLVPAHEVFTKGGEFRKSYLRKIQP
jgi:hypothetical protein